ncbi:RDD family protein [Kribbella sp. NPDC055071]
MTTPPYDGQPQQPPGQPGHPGYQPQFPPGQPGQYPPQGYNPYEQAAPGQGGYGYGYAPPGELASWPIRVGAYVLDYLIVAIPWFIGIIVALALDGDSDELGPRGGASMGVGFLLTFLLWVWSRVIQQGRTGQSFGKKLTGLRVVHAQTGQLIGVGATLGRELLAWLFNQFCILNVLWPLWDEKSQTWHDKIVNDVVIRADPQ